MLGFPIALLGSSPFFPYLSTPAYATSFISILPVIKRVCVAFQILTCIATTAIFCLRVCTLYDSHRGMRWFILAAFWTCAVSQVTISSITLYIVFPRTGMFHGYCTIIKPFTQNHIYVISASYITATPCEIIIILATLLHAVKTRRIVFTTGVVWPVLCRLYTDGAFWFVIEFCFRLWGCLQWLFCPNELKYLSDRLIYALQAVVAGRFFFILRRHIDNSGLSTSNVVCVSPSGKAVVESGTKSSAISSFPSSAGAKGFKGGSNVIPAFGSAHHSRWDHSGLPSALNTTTTTTQEGRSTQPYPITTFDTEERQISFVLPWEYELEETRSGLGRDMSTMQSTNPSV
ncbi:hypothetical protein FRC14_000146 [Serendipita sp. 396]|nr:hypothetical protein FRC14_000146 [Serendipita sp. 396]